MRSSTHARIALLVLLGIGLVPAHGMAQPAGVTKQHHPWGCFEPGAWNRVREVNETFEESGPIRTSTEITTTLDRIDDHGVTLRVEAVVEVGRRRIVRESQHVRQGWYGERVGQNVVASELGQVELAIKNRKIPCTLRRLEFTSAASKTVTDIYYSDTIEPFLLKRESVTTDLEGTSNLGKTTVEVVEMDVPARVLSSVKNAFRVKAVHTHLHGTTSVETLTSVDVPGSVVQQTTEHRDSHGQLTRRSSLEVVDFGSEPPPERSGLFGRKRAGRLRRYRATPPRFLAPNEPDD